MPVRSLLLPESGKRFIPSKARDLNRHLLPLKLLIFLSNSAYSRNSFVDKPSIHL
jgi:hypothetical protein